MSEVKQVPALGWTRRSAAVSIVLAMEEHRKEVALRLTALREARGLTQEELAYAAGVSNKTISRLENGRNEPELDTLRKLAKALDAEVREIQGDPPAPLGLGVTQLDRVEAKLDAILELLTPSLDEIEQETEQAVRRARRNVDAAAPTKRAARRAG